MEKTRIYKLDNGLEVLLRKEDGLHSIGVALATGYGTLYDETPGLAKLLQRAILYSKPDVTLAFREKGINPNAFVGLEAEYCGFNCQPESLGFALDRIYSLVSNTNFSKKRLEIESSGVIENNIVDMEEPEKAVEIKLQERMYRGSHFCISPVAENRGVLQLTPQDIRREAEKNYTAQNIVLTVYGAFDADKVIGKINKTFADMRPGANEGYESLPPPKRAPTKWIARGPVTQSKFAIGLYAPGGDPKTLKRPFFPAAMDCLVNTLTERLFAELRDRKSLVYSVMPLYYNERTFGELVISGGTPAQNRKAAVSGVLQELERLKNGEITKKEVSRSIAREKFELDKLRDDAPVAATDLAFNFVLGIPSTFQTDMLNAITIDEIRETAAEYLNPDDAHIVILDPETK